MGNNIDGVSAGEYFGWSTSVSADGLTVVIGSFLKDAVNVYQFDGLNWIQKGNTINGEESRDEFGWSVSISSDGSIIAVGAHWNKEGGIKSGHVRIYEFDGTDWVQLGNDIDGENPGDQFGESVSLSSNGLTLAIGAPFYDANTNDAWIGHVKIYQYDGINWVQKGSNIVGESRINRSGWSVSLSAHGSYVAIGAPRNNDNGGAAGHVRVYEFDGTDWVQVGNDIDGKSANDFSGYSVSISDDGLSVAIGSPRNSKHKTAAGQVRIYEFNGTNWIQKGGDINGEGADDLLGFSLSMNSDGSVVAIGAVFNQEKGFEAGHAQIYKFKGNNWVQQGNDIDAESSFNWAGHSVAIDSIGLIVAIGAPVYSDIANRAGHVRVFQFNDPIGLGETSLNEEIKIKPNPTRGVFTVKLKNNNDNTSRISIHNATGQTILIIKPNEQESMIDLSEMNPGIYFIRIFHSERNTIHKLIKE